jgi:hypothetical protein
MIHFFRKIRYQLAQDDQPASPVGRLLKYSRYAIGEIILVVLGILIALQINTWREVQKSELSTIEIYENLLISLRQDSTDIEQIITYHNNCLDAKQKLLTTSSDDIKKELTSESTFELIRDIIRGSVSFFPNSGVYNSIISNDEIDLIQNNDLKISLIKLYDHHYVKYANIDAVVDEKFQFQIFSVIDKNMMSYVIESVEGEEKMIKQVEPELFLAGYDDLVSEIKDTHRIMYTSRRVLLEIQGSINELINQILVELQKLKSN